MSNTVIKMELNDKQETQYQEWIKAIKVLHGTVGEIEWTISSNGLGYKISVYSIMADVNLDLTDVDEW